MKKTLQFILAFVLTIGIFIMPGTIAKAQEKEEKSISNNTIRFWAKADFGVGFWSDFKFLDMGDGTVRLRPVSNGNIINPSQLPDNTRLSHPYTVTFYDNLGNPYYSKDFPGNRSIKSVAQDLANVKMRYGLDSIQVTYELAKNYLVSISGGVKSNLDHSNFDNLYKETANKFSFRVERDGLYAERRDIKQDKIADGEYIIETAENSNRVLDIFSTNNNVLAADYNSRIDHQKFTLKYDNTNKAYKIKTNYGSNNLISWSSAAGNNVISHPDRDYADQFWYLEDAGNGSHRLINARNTAKILNLDVNNTNISVADRNNHYIKQQFKFVKPEDKKDTSIITGEWKIASKMNNDKVLNVNNNSSHNNVTIWDINNEANQKWIFNTTNNGSIYEIRNKSNNEFLAWDPTPFSRNVLVKSDTSGYYHQWILESVGNGYYMFKNVVNPELVLEIVNSNTGNGSNIQVGTKNNNDNQKFKLIS